MHTKNDAWTDKDGWTLSGAIGDLGSVGLSIVCFPVRATSDASLQGIEVRARGDRPLAAGLARQDCGLLGAHQLGRVLSASMAKVMAAHGTRLWIPLSLQALRDEELATSMRLWIQAGKWRPDLLTLAIAPDEVASDPQALARGLAELASCDARIAFTDVSVLSPSTWQDGVRSGCVDELRVSGNCTRRVEADSLAATAASMRELGVSVSALDVKTLEQCEVAIQGGLDAVQGSLVGRAHCMSELETRLGERIPSSDATLFTAAGAGADFS